MPQTSGDPSAGLPAWVEATANESIANTDVVLWHTFGITHFPAPEDYPIMPAEPMTLLLRPRHFFVQNPALDVPPSVDRAPSEVKRGAVADTADKFSRLAFDGGVGLNRL